MYDFSLSEDRAAKIVSFLQETFTKTGKTSAVLAVSGGIDSALSLTLLSRALDKSQIWPILLPYGRQDMQDAEELLEYLQIPFENRKTLNISSMVDAACQSLTVDDEDKVRKGNIMARMRMIAVFDYAKAKDALVVGTENKSEHYLGYFTRFGDQASDVEPIISLYKTEVRQLAQQLEVPEIFLKKAPSAGLWQGQSDEEEFGFSYELADQVLHYLVDEKKSESELSEIFSPEQTDLVKKVLSRVKAVDFKHQVPYAL